MIVLLTVGVVIATLLLLMAWRLIRALRMFRIKKHYTAAVDAPSVSVCIPARNEMRAMTECLERVLASDYKKMEIVVFDDSSTDDTSVLVRSFAHAGVRFVPGVKLPEGWLGKNHALDILAQEASGSIVIFMDVDTYIQPTTISQLVSYTLTEKVDMVSVIPRREDAYRASVLFGHLRYFWELVLSSSKVPAAASSLWLIRREALAELGGMAKVKASVAPESTLAQLLGTIRYHCLVGTSALGVAYEKKWHSQVETGRRLLLPKVNSHWYGSWLALGGLFFLNLPSLGLASVLFIGWMPFHALVLTLFIISMAIYGVYTFKLWGSKGWWLGALLWPVVIFQELVIFLTSVWGYVRHTVTWKGRPVATAVRADRVEI